MGIRKILDLLHLDVLHYQQFLNQNIDVLNIYRYFLPDGNF